jgi:hypothetical protein
MIKIHPKLGRHSQKPTLSLTERKADAMGLNLCQVIASHKVTCQQLSLFSTLYLKVSGVDVNHS